MIVDSDFEKNNPAAIMFIVVWVLAIVFMLWDSSKISDQSRKCVAQMMATSHYQKLSLRGQDTFINRYCRTGFAENFHRELQKEKLILEDRKNQW